MLKRLSRFFYGLNDAVKKMALMIYLTDFSTASKILNLHNPIQGTVRFRSVG